uniref:AIG1-type G domain-containing protein n=1 Tax=Electrophorus electricus TaxID=8005 RepID=A0AAY5EM25_ELEEL
IGYSSMLFCLSVGAMDEWRIVLLGKTGDGKSSTGNLILGEKVFGTDCSPNSQTHECNLKTKSMNEKLITVIDTPGLFDTSLTSEELNSEILRCVTECAPGPHAFVIVLKVGRYTKHEIETVKKITDKYCTLHTGPCSSMQCSI